MSQHQPGFRGGLTPGTLAVTGSSRALESQLRCAAPTVQPAAAERGLVWTPGFSAAELAERFSLPSSVAVAGVYPDGAIFCDDTGAPRCASEAKRQGETGNAIERWFKNATVLRSLGVDAYLTVCTGAGFFDANSSQRILELAVAADRDERPRLAAATVWNHPHGRLWLYRFATPAAARLDHLFLDACRTTLTIRC